ncbi:MAG: DUF6206 family protein [Candidatus Geothermincolia bacterium]
MDLEIDLDLLREFELNLDPRHPDRSEIPARVLGYGEISTVFEIGSGSQVNIAYKRMPVFEKESELEAYRWIFREYNRLLASEVGLNLPRFGYGAVDGKDGRPVMFLAQEKLDAASIGSAVIHAVSEDDAVRLVTQVLKQLARVWDFNAQQDEVEIGIDGQISNWAVKGYDPAGPRLPGEMELVYLDTSTPFMRLAGVEQLDPELFLRSAPSFMVWVLRMLFLEDVMTRYYDFHLVAVDIVANFYKEQLPGMIPWLVEATNDFFENEVPELGIEPITAAEVKSYYREDAIIWRLYLSMRRTDRFLRTRLARKGYPYILPGKIKR